MLVLLPLCATFCILVESRWMSCITRPMHCWLVKGLKILQYSAATRALPRNSLFVSASALFSRPGLRPAAPTPRFSLRQLQNPSQERIVTNETPLVLW